MKKAHGFHVHVILRNKNKNWKGIDEIIIIMIILNI
jgi:hypothetical protein